MYIVYLASTPLTVAPGYDKTTAFCDDVDNLFALKCLNILLPTYNVIFSETSDTLILLSTGDTSTLFTEIYDIGKATGFGGVNNVGLGFNSRKVKLILGFWE